MQTRSGGVGSNFREQGEADYRDYQREHEEQLLTPGVAFPLIKRLLRLNGEAEDDKPVEVVLLSRNDPDTGLRVMNSIRQYGLNISRAAFVGGANPIEYMEAFHASLFLSGNTADVEAAVAKGLPAAKVFPTQFVDDEEEQLRIAFDFDGILADDSAEAIFQQERMDAFHARERDMAHEALPEGPLGPLLRELSKLQQWEKKRMEQEADYVPCIRIAIVTARNAPAHERVVTTLRKRGIYVDETFFLGGIDKGRILKVFRPHIFFDDQISHIEGVASISPSAHVPYGVTNQRRPGKNRVDKASSAD
ncbi:5'-nucleotidase [Gorillibacterium sp. CAU 1737]|uniref:5'-nucleotidase n=1 Tax=Gorillibacterium sp. CAU 1737 TaxID=3140362 RepID=UPI003261971E